MLIPLPINYNNSNTAARHAHDGVSIPLNNLMKTAPR